VPALLELLTLNGCFAPKAAVHLKKAASGTRNTTTFAITSGSKPAKRGGVGNHLQALLLGFF
jgi:hypothetical protein